MPPDRITANLPSRNFDATGAFYGLLGFDLLYRDTGWMILKRDTMEIEFFLHPDLDPAQSWFSACIRVDDLTGLRAQWNALDLLPDPMGRPRDMGLVETDAGIRFFPLIDPDGSLIRCIDNGSV